MARANLNHHFQPTVAHHAGLWFDRYLRNQSVKGTKASTKQEPEPRQQHVKETANIEVPTIYRSFFEDWKQSLLSTGAKTAITAQTTGRLAIGLGNESPIETSISLHHTYGLPFIPGSALKGLAAHYADRRLGDEWKKGTPAFEVLFGYTEKQDDEGKPTLADAGYVTFFDALYVPDSGTNRQPLHPDIITVHHPNYYNQDIPDAPQDVLYAPADWDSPTPIPFLTATGSFLLALAGPETWVKAAYTILAHALAEWGVGAKTSSGYGRMTLSGEAWLPQLANIGLQANAGANPPVASALSSPLETFLTRLQNLKSQHVAGQIQKFYGQWEKMKSDMPNEKEAIRQAAKAILDKIQQAGKDKQFSDRTWYQTLLKSLE